LIDKLKKNRFLSRFFSEEQQKRYENILLQSGGIILFFSRVWWPLAWIMPFLAGSFKLPYKTFLLFNTPGIFVWIGSFLFVWYFLWVNIPLMKQIFSVYFPLLSAAWIFLFLVFFLMRKFLSQYLSKSESLK
jgi:membrane protein DedA with SNARE-associated domain